MFDSSKLKVGDKIIVSDYNNRKITKVLKITPTGRIRVEGYPNTQFDNRGSQMGGDIWHILHLEEATAEKVEQIEKEKIVRIACNMMNKCKKLTYEQAVKIIEILGETREN